MILLDTNVVSEPYRARTDLAVIRWLDRQQRVDLYLCTPVLAELHYGAERLPPGARRDRLADWLRQVEHEFADRTLAFDRAASHAFARVAVIRSRLGRPVGTLDAMIAAIALTQGAVVATRDIDDFAGLGLDVVNPFTLR